MTKTPSPSSEPSSSPFYYPTFFPSHGIIRTFAGSDQGGFGGDNGAATNASLNHPAGIAIDSSGNVYFSDTNNHRVRKVTALTGIITTYAGTGFASSSGDGGVATSASIYLPNGLCIDSAGTYFFYYYICNSLTSFARQYIHIRVLRFSHP